MRLSLPGKFRRRIHETKRRPKRIPAIKKPLTPRHHLDRRINPRPRQDRRRPRRPQIRHRKVKILQRMRLPIIRGRVAIRHRIEARQNNPPAIKVMPPARYPPAGRAQQPPVKKRGLLDIGNGEDNAVEMRHGKIRPPRARQRKNLNLLPFKRQTHRQHAGAKKPAVSGLAKKFY
jgi:hypothetical protein